MNGMLPYARFVTLHKPQLVLSNIPEHFWPILARKLNERIFDSGSSFALLQVDYDDAIREPHDPIWAVQAITDISRSCPDNIFLVDHAWTFKANTVSTNLRNIPSLLERMCNMMLVDGATTEEKINKVSNQLWKYAQTYAIGDAEFSVEDRVPIWYIMDELGSGIQHSDTPNFRAVPFVYVPEQCTYTLLFPIEDVEEGDFVTRNFVEGSFDSPVQRDALLLPWKEYEHYDCDFKQEEPSPTYFLEGHIVETISAYEPVLVEKPEILKVYSEYTYIQQYLTSPHFELVDNVEDAHILWYTNHFKKFRELSELHPDKMVNQFPFEYVITIKDLLAIIGRRCKAKEPSENPLETQPAWLPTTFNLKTELPQFLSYFKKREDNDMDNVWICKPYNLARALDTYISDNINFLCRLPMTGPKVAQKYIDNPVLFDRPEIGKVKFDVRYVILLKSVHPTKVYIYKNFFLRFANKPFALNNYEDYEQHFTVMNYNENTPLYRLLCADFKEEWSKQYPQHKWSQIEEKIFSFFKDLFTAATSKEPPCGIAGNPQSRALYAADVMISWNKKGEVEPKLLEVNWMPDCQRACIYYPDFYNDIFTLLFKDKAVDSCVEIM